MCACKKTYFVERGDGARFFEDENKSVPKGYIDTLRADFPDRKYTLKWRLVSERTGVEDEN